MFYSFYALKCFAVSCLFILLFARYLFLLSDTLFELSHPLPHPVPSAIPHAISSSSSCRSSSRSPRPKMRPERIRVIIEENRAGRRPAWGLALLI
jgi:hypothetical protein